MVGTTLGHYQIQDQIGEGGMGVVYRARDTHLDRFVAIKVLPETSTLDAERVRRFILEAKAASALSHSNIVAIHDINQQNGVYYIAMEFVEGRTLDRTIPRHGLPLADALTYAAQIADALAAAHASGILHRDIKPANLMLTARGQVKVLDFGLAKLTEADDQRDDTRTMARSPATEEGTIVGTTWYMSPEQAQGKRLDARSDIFSFGTVLYEMLTGQRAFQGETKMAALAAVINQEPNPVSTVTPRGSVPPEVERVLSRCLRKDPARRFQTMADLKVALEELREESSSVRLTTLSTIPATTRGRWLTAALTAGVMTAGVATWWYFRSSAAPSPQMRTVPLTSYVGGERAPSFSPDGRQVAFAWNGESRSNMDIYVKLVDGGESLRLTHDPATDQSPAWSPDGRQIAFRRGDGIYLISPLGGSERQLTTVQGPPEGLTWSPDGKLLAFSDQESAGRLAIFTVSMETGERRQMTVPKATGGDHGPGFSPDGRSLAFLRQRARGGASEVMVIAPANGTPRKLALQPDFMSHLTWTPDAKDVIVTVQRQAGNPQLWRVPVNGDPASRVPGIPDGAGNATISGATGRMAYSLGVSETNIWSLETRPGSTATRVIASTRRDFSPHFSRDGRRIAFTSDRTGGWEIWRSDSNGGHEVQLTSFGGVVADSARWSPDGREVVFAVLAEGNREVYVMAAEGGVPKKLTTESSDEGRPSFSVDGRSVYFRSNRSGADQLWKMPREGGTPVQITRSGGFEPFESPDGKTIFYAKDRNLRGLWNVPTGGGEEKPVAGLEQVAGGLWGIAEDGIYYIAGPSPASQATPGAGLEQAGGNLYGIAEPTVFSAPPRRSIEKWEFQSGRVTQLGTITPQLWTAPNSFSVAHDGTRVLWHQVDHLDADLMLVENFAGAR